jgi:hypothetical protein
VKTVLIWTKLAWASFWGFLHKLIWSPYSLQEHINSKAGANPTIAIYNAGAVKNYDASAVKNYNAACSIHSAFSKHNSLILLLKSALAYDNAGVVVCKIRSPRIGTRILLW